MSNHKHPFDGSTDSGSDPTTKPKRRLAHVIRRDSRADVGTPNDDAGQMTVMGGPQGQDPHHEDAGQMTVMGGPQGQDPYHEDAGQMTVMGGPQGQDPNREDETDDGLATAMMPPSSRSSGPNVVRRNSQQDLIAASGKQGRREHSGVEEELTVDEEAHGVETVLFGPGHKEKPEAAPPNDPRRGFLQVISGNDVGRRVGLLEGRTSIGRGLDCDIVLTDVSVSRRHAYVERRDEIYVVSDLSSGNGTLVNGSARRDETIIVNGDEFVVGNTRFRFEGPEAQSDDWQSTSLGKGKTRRQHSEEVSTVSGRGLGKAQEEDPLTQLPTNIVSSVELDDELAAVVEGEVGSTPPPQGTENLSLSAIEELAVEEAEEKRKKSAFGEPLVEVSADAAPAGDLPNLSLPPQPAPAIPFPSAPPGKGGPPMGRPMNRSTQQGLGVSSMGAMAPAGPPAPFGRGPGAPMTGASNMNTGAPMTGAPNMNTGAPMTGAPNMNTGAPITGAPNMNTGAPITGAPNVNYPPGYPSHSASMTGHSAGIPHPLFAPTGPKQGPYGPRSRSKNPWLMAVLAIGVIGVTVGIVFAVANQEGNGTQTGAQASRATQSEGPQVDGETESEPEPGADRIASLVAGNSQVPVSTWGNDETFLTTLPSAVESVAPSEADLTEGDATEAEAKAEAEAEAKAEAEAEAKAEAEAEAKAEAEANELAKAKEKRKKAEANERKTSEASSARSPSRANRSEPSRAKVPRRSKSSAAALSEAKSLYNREKFSQAADVLEDGADTLSGRDADKLLDKAAAYRQVGSLMEDAEAYQADKNYTKALPAYKKALSKDKRDGGGAHSRLITARLGQVAPKAAFSYMTRKRYIDAKEAAQDASRYGQSDAVQVVFDSLERKAESLIRKAERAMDDGDDRDAEGYLKEAMRIAPKGTPAYEDAKDLMRDL